MNRFFAFAIVIPMTLALFLAMWAFLAVAASLM